MTSRADEATLPAGWQAPAPATRGAAAYRRTDGAEVFFDRRSRPDNPLDNLRPGWNWLARRPEGTMLGHHVAGPTGGEAGVENGLFLPRKFKTAVEAMRALDRDAPRPPAPAPGEVAADAVGVELGRLERRGGDLLGPGGTLVPRVGITWEAVRLEAPLNVGILPPADRDEHPRGALVGAPEAGAFGIGVVPVGEEDVQALRRLADKLVVTPSASRARALREFLDFLAANAVPAPAPGAKQRKRITLHAPMEQAT